MPVHVQAYGSLRAPQLLRCRAASRLLAVCSGSGGCPCTCEYGADTACQCRSLPQPLNITLTKTPAVIAYPLTYQRSFDAQPTEVGTVAGRIVRSTVQNTSAELI